MKTRALWAAAAMLTLGPAVFAQAPDAAPTAANPTPTVITTPYTLRYKFKQGDVSYYKLTMDMNGVIGGGPNGQSFPLKQHMEFVYHQTVTGVNTADGAATVTTGFDTLSVLMNGQPLPNADAMLQQMKSRTITTTITPTGKPSSVKVDGPDGAMPGMDFSKMANFQGAAQLPAGPVRVGDTWKGLVDVNGALTPQMPGMQATVASTLDGVDSSTGKSVASINQVTKATFDSASLPGAAAGMGVAGGVNGTGILKFDADAGAVVSQTSTSTLDMTMTPKAGTTTGMTGPMKIQFQISTDLEKTTAAAAVAAPPAVSPASFTKPGPDGSYLYGKVF